MHGATLLLLLSGGTTQPATTPGSAVLGRSPLATFVLAAGIGVEEEVEIEPIDGIDVLARPQRLEMVARGQHLDIKGRMQYLDLKP